MTLRSTLAVAAVLVCVLALHGCGHSSTTPTSPSTPGGNTTTPTTTVFQGTVAISTTDSATLTLSIQAAISTASVAGVRNVATASPASTSAVTGTVFFNPLSVTLVGTYDSASGAVSVAGAGYSLTGTVSGNVLSGTYSNSVGDTGTFSSLNTAKGAFAAYCGNGTGIDGTSATINFQVAGTALSGEWQDKNGSGTLSGVITGTSFTLTTNTGNSGTGTIQNGLITGSISGSKGGTFSAGNTCGTVPAPPSGTSGVTPGTWSYSMSAAVALNSSACNTTVTGTATVASDGSFTLAYSAPCGGCTMSGNASGVLALSGVSGTISASESPNGPPCTAKGGPLETVSASGTCKNATTCSLGRSTNASYGANFSLTIP